LLAVPLAEVFAPLPLMLVLPLIQRKAIPLVSWFETLGKRSYGLYLTNLLVITLLVALVKAAHPGCCKSRVRWQFCWRPLR
jgi:peptidoglycan/LPS O-acetylase OafA/YrhL